MQHIRCPIRKLYQLLLSSPQLTDVALAHAVDRQSLRSDPLGLVRAWLGLPSLRDLELEDKASVVAQLIRTIPVPSTTLDVYLSEESGHTWSSLSEPNQTILL
jgi:hypothetical protein